MRATFFYGYATTKLGGHHYYVIHVKNETGKRVLKKYYNVNNYTYDAILNDLNYYEIDEIDYKINKLKTDKETYLQAIQNIKDNENRIC